MKIRRSLLKQQVTVQTYAGDGATGPVYAPPVTVWAMIDRTRRLVRDTAGREVVSEATLTLHPVSRIPGGGDVDTRTLFTAESLLTLDDGTPSRVITTQPWQIRGVTAAYEVTCQ